MGLAATKPVEVMKKRVSNQSPQLQRLARKLKLQEISDSKVF